MQNFSRQDLDFLLHEMYGNGSAAKDDRVSGFDREVIGQTLDLATDLAETYLDPYYQETSDHHPQMTKKGLKVHPAIRRYIASFASSGLLAAPFPSAWGGHELPRLVNAAAKVIAGSANNSFVMYTDLIRGVSRLILRFGTDDQRTRYLPKLLSGQWAATMCLTEPGAGSSLSDIETRVTKGPAGVYHIAGQKIFISAGDHDATDNIIHLVLARLEGSEPGVKGLSLFIVPKMLATESGSDTQNAVRTVTAIHKMGQTATPAVQLAFGDGGPCTGYLLGKVEKGMEYMFHMMNDARLDTGLAGVYIASRAYYHSLQYARERLQGRERGVEVPIIRHPDVRRMLLAQKSFVEGMLCLALQCYHYIDLIRVERDPRYQLLLDLLTPVVKANGAEMACRSVYEGMQVMGGYGYTRDFEMEQLTRDVRILPIYEGTNGIQSITLLRRSMRRESVELWVELVMDVINEARMHDTLQHYAEQLTHDVHGWEETARSLMRLRATDSPELLIDASLFMTYFGILNMAWQWLRMGIVAVNALHAGVDADKQVFYRSKLHTLAFYFHYEVRKCQSMYEQFNSRHALTSGDMEHLIR